MFRAAIVLLCLLNVSLAGGQDIFLLTDSGAYTISVVNGVPGAPVEFEGVVIDLRTNGPPPKDDQVAIQVDKWADLENQALRQNFVEIWSEAVAKVKDGSLTIEDARTSWIKERHDEIFNANGGAWVTWAERVAGLIDDQLQSGTFSIGTLQSVVDGLKM